MRLQPETEHPHGLSDAEFDSLFTTDKPVVFAYHGYPWLIHRLTYRRTNHANLHVRGYKEEGTTTTPFDMVMLNDLDRFHLVIDVIDRVPGLGSRAGPRPPADGRQADRGAGVHAARGRGRCPRSRTGRGRPPVRPGADPRRQRGVEQPQAAGARPADDVLGRVDGPRPRSRTEATRLGRRRDRPAGAGRTPSATGWSTAGRGSPGRSRLDDAATERDPRAHDARPAPPAEVARRDRRGSAGAARRPGGRLLRHGVPRDAARGRVDLRDPARVAAARGRSAATGSTGSPTPTRRGARRSCLGARATRRSGS